MDQALAASTASIVGTWYVANPGGGTDHIAFSFLADGTFMVADQGTVANDPSGTSGLEWGTYTWDPAAGALAFAVQINTDGQWGLSNSGINNAVVTSDTLTLSGPEGPFSVPRLTSPPDSIVGSWYATPHGGGSTQVVFTFLADGTYILADKGDHAVDPNGTSGIEYGTYTWDAATGAFASATLVNTDGQWGLSDNHGALTKMVVSGDQLLAGNATVLNATATRLSPVVAVTSTITGTPNADTLIGTAAADTILGLDGNDSITGGGGNDTITGAAGIDTAYYAGGHASYSLTKTDAGFTVSGGTEGSDTLTGIERLHFGDQRLALDIDGNAGNVARIIGAVFGAASLSIKEYLGIGLSYLDSGMSYQDLMQLAIGYKLGGSSTNHAAVVNLLYGNVIGGAPSPDLLAQYTGLLDNGSQTNGSLGVLAAGLPQNEAHINLTGLAQTGIEFV